MLSSYVTKHECMKACHRQAHPNSHNPAPSHGSCSSFALRINVSLPDACMLYELTLCKHSVSELAAKFERVLKSPYVSTPPTVNNDDAESVVPLDDSHAKDSPATSQLGSYHGQSMLPQMQGFGEPRLVNALYEQNGSRHPLPVSLAVRRCMQSILLCHTSCACHYALCCATFLKSEIICHDGQVKWHLLQQQQQHFVSRCLHACPYKSQHARPVTGVLHAQAARDMTGSSPDCCM